MAKKVHSLSTFLEEKYGMKAYNFTRKLTPTQKDSWKKINGRARILTPKAIQFIYEILGEPIE